MIAQLGNLGWCELEDIKPPCDPYKTQEFGCVCADAEGFLLTPDGRRAMPAGVAPQTPVFAFPDLDAKTIGLALGVLVVVMMVRK